MSKKDDTRSTKNRKKPTEEERLVLSWCDSRVNGSVSAMIGVAFGIFAILRLYDTTVPKFLTLGDVRWELLTLSYFFLGVLGVYLYLRAVAYSTMQNIKGREIGIGTGDVFELLKTRIRNGQDLDLNRFNRWLQMKSIPVIENRWLMVIVLGILYYVAWFAVAFRY